MHFACAFEIQIQLINTLQNKERSRIEDGLKSFELDDIDKICREIETDEERRQRRKRSHQDSQPTETQAREARENRKESVKLEMRRPGNKDWVLKTVDIVVEHLNKFGACIIDDFLGPDRGHDILEEVESLQAAQMFRGGQLVTASATADRFRTDQITWTDGISPPSPSIRHLIRLMMMHEQCQSIDVSSDYQIARFMHHLVTQYSRLDCDRGQCQTRQGRPGGVRHQRADQRHGGLLPRPGQPLRQARGQPQRGRPVHHGYLLP